MRDAIYAKERLRWRSLSKANTEPRRKNNITLMQRRMDCDSRRWNKVTQIVFSDCICH
jgi:hypothetical protein